MKVFTIVACILSAALVAFDPVRGSALRSPLEYEAQFAQWMDAYDVHFDEPLEYAKRLQTFIANDRFINAHNSHRGVSFLLGHNEYSHLTSEEFFANKKGLRMPEGYLESRIGSHGNSSDDEIRRRPVVVEDSPASVDWVAKGGVTPVKNQGQCGSCWAFSTTGAVEGAAFVASGKLVSVSEQELVDCDHNGDMGCNGGLMDHAFDWIHTQGGICAEAKYEYHAAAEQCRQCEAVVKVSSYTDVTTSDEAALKAAVAKQPVSVAIEADKREFQFYKSGVFDLECGTQLDHGVLVVGYGQDTDNGKKFWKVKNSWGATWGEAGFIRLSREMGRPEGQCGIAVAPSYPTASLITEEKAEEVSGPEQDLELREQAIADLEAMLLADLEEPCETELLMMEERAEARGQKQSVFEYFEEQN